MAAQTNSNTPGRDQSFLFACVAAVLVLVPTPGQAQRPPAEVETDPCSIMALFSHLTTITSDPRCRAGCAGGECPTEWYPGADDKCSADCGATFEPFWDQCGDMLTQAQMGGMDEMGLFYETCLESLYPPGACGTFCNQHTFECLTGEVQSACCDEHGANCPQDGASVVPLTCQVGCAIVFPAFLDSCRTHITESGLDVAEFDSFKDECLEVDGLALVEYAIDLQERGCTINLHPRNPHGGAGGVSTGGHRRAQDLFMSQWIGGGAPGCSWDDLDDILANVNVVCCGDGECEGTDQPARCSPGCAVAMHSFMTMCGVTVVAILGEDSPRLQSVQTFEQGCLDAADPSFFLHAIENANCGEQLYEIYAARANADDAAVTAITPGTEISLNGVSQGILGEGEVWTGTVNSGDVFSAREPIYGVVRTATATCAMIPSWLGGTEFAIANSRRDNAVLYINCHTHLPCHVTVSNSQGVRQTKDIRSHSFVELTMATPMGPTESIVVSSSAPIVLAVANDNDTDYIPVPPVSEEQYGIPSSVLSVATAGGTGMWVDESCSDGSTRQIDLPGAGMASETRSFPEQYNGKGCKYSSAQVDANGMPRTLSAHGFGDGDGGDATPFLPTALFSTEFMTPIEWEFLAFVSDQVGTVTIFDSRGQEVALPLEGDDVTGVFKVKYQSPSQPGQPGVRITSTVPVWAMMESKADDDEQLLYGRVDPAVATVAEDLLGDPDTRLYRLFAARANDSPAFVASIADGNELFLNGESLITLSEGEIWSGTVNSGDIFAAAHPIYGIVQTSSGEHVMIPGRLKGTEFAIANTRRSNAHLYVNCLEVACHVSYYSARGGATIGSVDVDPDSFQEIVVAGASGTQNALVVTSSAPIVLAIADGADTDYMPVPPVAEEQYGIPSTILSMATAEEAGINVKKVCSDMADSAGVDLQLPSGGSQLEEGGYPSQYTGQACRFFSTTLNGGGHPLEFSGHGYGDGDGGDCTPFLKPSLFSTEFVTPVQWEWLAFAGDQPGTITLKDASGAVIAQTPLSSGESTGVWKAYIQSGGSAGMRITSTVPVWAAMEARQSNDEQLLYGDMPSQTVDVDRQIYRLFAARANGHDGIVASIVDDNEIRINGIVQGTLNAGELWTGTMTSGDIVTARGPIYGVIRTATGSHVMIPGRLKGTQFAIANSRRAVAHLYVNCLDVACHVTVSTASSTDSRDIRPDSSLEIVVTDPAGSDQAIVVTSSAPIVLAIADEADTDYMPVPPVSAEQMGIPSTVLSVATAGGPMAIHFDCTGPLPGSDSHTGTSDLPGSGHQLEVPGWDLQYTGIACQFSSASVANDGTPRGFGSHGYGDGDGGDSTPFLPPTLFSTEFVTPIEWEFLAFVSDQPGTVTIEEDIRTIAIELVSGQSDAVFSCRVTMNTDGITGAPGTRITSSVPVWAMMESRADDDEQLLYGRFV